MNWLIGLVIVAVIVAIAATNEGPLSRARVTELAERCRAQKLAPVTMVALDSGVIYQVQCRDGRAWWDAKDLPRAIATPVAACDGCVPDALEKE